MVTETDERGRLYLSKDIRDRFGERFHVVEFQNRIELVPVDEDPVQGLREAVGDAFDGKSVAELRREAREQALVNGLDDVRRD